MFFNVAREKSGRPGYEAKYNVAIITQKCVCTCTVVNSRLSTNLICKVQKVHLLQPIPNPGPEGEPSQRLLRHTTELPILYIHVSVHADLEYQVSICTVCVCARASNRYPWLNDSHMHESLNTAVDPVTKCVCVCTCVCVHVHA